MTGLGVDSRALALALDDIGVVAGDLVYFQICAEPECEDSVEDACAEIYTALREAVGPEGTILAPTFTFSFCRGEVYDPDRSATTGGPYNSFAAFPEYLRRRPDAVRSEDPIFSVTGEGPAAAALLSNLPHDCLGHDCVFDRVRKAGGKLVLMGIGLFEAVFRHYVESVLRVPWRYDKLFAGRICSGGETRREVWTYNVRIWAPNGDPAGETLEGIALAEGVGQARPVGDTFLQMAQAQAFYDLCVRELTRDPWSTAAGPPGDVVDIERKRIGFARTPPVIPRNASMAEISDTLRPLARDLLSAGYDAALAAFAARTPIEIEHWRTGDMGGGWLIPEEWNCRGARVETLDGQVMLEADGDSSRLRRYARAFDGIVDGEALRARVESDPGQPQRLPFSAGWLDREWGFTATGAARDALVHPRYRVSIDTTFSLGALGIGAWRIAGESANTIVLDAHLTRTRDDDEMIDGAIVAAELARALASRDQRRWSYLLLLSPAPIGAAPYLERHAEQAALVQGAIRFGALGNSGAFTFASSNAHTSALEPAFAALRGVTQTIPTGEPDELARRMPTLTLSRQGAPEADRGIHLGESLRMAFALIDALEAR